MKIEITAHNHGFVAVCTDIPNAPGGCGATPEAAVIELFFRLIFQDAEKGGVFQPTENWLKHVTYAAGYGMRCTNFNPLLISSADPGSEKLANAVKERIDRAAQEIWENAEAVPFREHLVEVLTRHFSDQVGYHIAFAEAVAKDPLAPLSTDPKELGQQLHAARWDNQTLHDQLDEVRQALLLGRHMNPPPKTRIGIEVLNLVSAMEKTKGITHDGQERCDDCSPEFNDCWNGQGPCRKREIASVRARTPRDDVIVPRELLQRLVRELMDLPAKADLSQEQKDAILAPTDLLLLMCGPTVRAAKDNGSSPNTPGPQSNDAKP
jgi:hypothetical protein